MHSLSKKWRLQQSVVFGCPGTGYTQKRCPGHNLADWNASRRARYFCRHIHHVSTFASTPDIHTFSENPAKIISVLVATDYLEQQQQQQRGLQSSTKKTTLTTTRAPAHLRLLPPPLELPPPCDAPCVSLSLARSETILSKSWNRAFMSCALENNARIEQRKKTDNQSARWSSGRRCQYACCYGNRLLWCILLLLLFLPNPTRAEGFELIPLYA